MTGHSTDAVVSAEWLQDRLGQFQSDDPNYRLLEVDVEPEHYETDHIPSAVGLDWQTDLQDTETFDVLSRTDLGQLLGECGITPDTTLVLYGDFYNWFAAHTYWVLRYYGHEDLKLLDGGRDYWLANDYPTTDSVPSVPGTTYDVPPPDESMRADKEDVKEALDSATTIVDVRAPPEYRGEILAPPGWNEGVQRGGHIPGAENIPCRCIIRPDRRFKPSEELAGLYEETRQDDEEIILYCRVGERAALTWFVLTELLDYEAVKYYYGSWVEWGNTVGLPIEQPSMGRLRSEK